MRMTITAAVLLGMAVVTAPAAGQLHIADRTLSHRLAQQDVQPAEPGPAEPQGMERAPDRLGQPGTDGLRQPSLDRFDRGMQRFDRPGVDRFDRVDPQGVERFRQPGFDRFDRGMPPPTRFREPTQPFDFPPPTRFREPAQQFDFPPPSRRLEPAPRDRFDFAPGQRRFEPRQRDPQRGFEDRFDERR